MSNVIQFPQTGTDHRHAIAAFLEDPARHAHAVQFYEEEEFLFDTVGQFLGAGLKRGDGILVIAARPHIDEFLGRLHSATVQEAIREGRLVLLDAHEALTKFMIGDMPDPDLFRDLLSRVMGSLRSAIKDGARIRAYGEMVDLLWRNGNARAALRLEDLWNETGREHTFSLLCAYVMGNFYREGDAERFLQVCRTHNHVIPTETFVNLDDSQARLREITLLQQRARALENEIQHRKELEGALRDALRERGKVEEELRASLKREQSAREQAEASDAFKEVFLGILGHDLRNPLNTILTTARIMVLRRELSAESHKKMERMIASGVRMQRMIEQLLDVARARLADGIPVDRGEHRDIVPLVTKIVDEVRAANPARTIELDASACQASVDADRFEQVISNLLGNAVFHGAEDRPIRVVVSARDEIASVSVHNHGRPIDPSFVPRLFDPFKRAKRPVSSTAGLGLGLYIAERIVSAHGGSIGVSSDEETGTRFEAIFPRA